MNIISLFLACCAAIVFAGTTQGHKWGTLGLGLLLLTAAWVLQLILTIHQITL